MYDLQDWAAVQRVYKQTRSKRATAKILGMSRNTVRSLLEEKEAPVYKRTVYKSKIDGFKRTDHRMAMRTVSFQWNTDF